MEKRDKIAGVRFTFEETEWFELLEKRGIKKSSLIRGCALFGLYQVLCLNCSGDLPIFEKYFKDIVERTNDNLVIRELNNIFAEEKLKGGRKE